MTLNKNIYFILILINFNSLSVTLKELVKKPNKKLKQKLNIWAISRVSINLSNLELTNITGISNLKAIINGQEKEITKAKNLELNLDNNELSSIPKEIEKFKKLKILSLGNNKLISLNKELSSLSKLVNLQLDFNKIKKIDFKNWSNSLSYLNLSNNELEAIPDNISNLTNLEKLNLSNNNITSLNKEIANLHQLKTLILDSNKIKEIDFKDWNNNIINFLNIDNNELEIIPDNIRNLTNLKALYLDNNKIIYIPESIGKLKLESLSLDYNKIKEIPKSICNNKTLARIFLNSNKIQIIPSINLPKLKLFELQNNNINKVSPSFNASELLHLLINNNLLEDIEFINNLNKLGILDASNNKLNDKSIGKVKLNKTKQIIIFLINNYLKNKPLQKANPNTVIFLWDNEIQEFKALKKIDKLPIEIIRYIYTFLKSYYYFSLEETLIPYCLKYGPINDPRDEDIY